MTIPSTQSAACAVNRLVPFVHVADVDASIAFYAQLGFTPVRTLRDPASGAFWAMLASGSAEIMFARASGPIDETRQAVLFYMYANDVAALRRHLLDRGLADGGKYQGHAGGRRTVFGVVHRDYMPAGELRVHDPDGYCILVGQLG